MRFLALGFLTIISSLASAQSGSAGRSEAPDLTGTWFGGFQPGLFTVQEGGSVCMAECDEIEGSEEARRMLFPPTERPIYKPEHQERVDYLNEMQVMEDPVLRCENPGLPRIGAPDKIIQNDREVVFLYDDVNGSFWRIIPTDGRTHHDDLEPTFLGDGVGHWEGETLVVETINFSDETWLTDDGAFHSEALRIVERFQRTGDKLEYHVTVHDPEVLAEPWVKAPRELSLTDIELVESPPCRDKDLPLMQDLSSHDNPR